MTVTRTAPKPTLLSMDDLVSPTPGTLAVASANGGKPLPLPKTGDVSDELVGLILQEDGGIDSLLHQERQLSVRMEMLAAAMRTLAAVPATVEPDQFRAAVRAAAAERATAAGRSHAFILAQVEKQTQKEHTLVRHHYSFLAEAGIAPSDVATRSRVKLLISPGSLLDHPGFGTAFCASLARKLVIHTGVFGMIATTEPIRTAHSLTRQGSTCWDHSALLFAPLPADRLESLDQMQQGKDGEESVVLVSAPIQSTAAVLLEGPLALAGKYFRDMTAGGGFGSHLGGLNSKTMVSDAYLTPPLPPFVNDFNERADRIPGGVVVGASGTDPVTMDRLLYCFLGIHVAAARRKEPAYQISVRLAQNYLRRVLKVAGHLLLPLPRTERAEGVRKLEGMLRKQLVGLLPRMFESLSLRIDQESAEGKDAISKGGLLLKVEVKLNSRTESVRFTIEQLTDGPNQPADRPRE